MIGSIEVYLYNEENGQREDLTESLGNKKFNVYEHRFELVRPVKVVYSTPHLKNKYLSFYTLSDINPDFLPKFFMFNHVYIIKGGIEHQFAADRISCNIEDHNKRQTYGNDYERFIADKYKYNGYDVEDRGIKNSFNDGGLDIIARKDNKLILVQCKNWTMSNSYKINQKDIRAFVGDCFLYLQNINLEEIKVSYHFIVSHDNILTKSAEIFLKQNTFIKFKCVAFQGDTLIKDEK
ncbi:restriction endonuclease [Poseidonibacter lekithochrous]|uniref:restriction endonuclease n=1 Tax=Poseidonibacter TaxID=2321187 RepID=UPI001C09C8B1|nr:MULTISPECIES: restriction endonuclease [Poseidonibacter]MBU3015128.1 restriction endonuclease [Poseidonibacter lekithochrous]MDO6828425.1 restriction endonuclease [Poseidonibacter sp. 1_MG-2023]